MMTNRAHKIFKPHFRFGLGGLPLGNEFTKHTDEDAEGTLEAAWDLGIRYFDVAPCYGLGLAERRFGRFLRNKRREDFLLSSKVGKTFEASKEKNCGKPSDLPNATILDYTADGIRRSIEDSLQRLGVGSLDIVFVHDIPMHFQRFSNGRERLFEIARDGAFPELSKMRNQGIIQAWGVCVNTPELFLKVTEHADPDVCLCVGQYSLIDHATALNTIFPAVHAKKVPLVIGSSLNAGFISGSPRYNYGRDNFNIPPTAIEKRDEFRSIARFYGVDLRTAALQFSAAASEAIALIVGAGCAEQIFEDYNSMQVKIPANFWIALKQEKLIEPNAAIPILTS